MATIRRALITGLHGFTGHYVAAELAAAGYEIHGVGMSVPGTTHANYREVDLLDAQQVIDAVASIRPHVVVHLAAIAFVAHGDAEAFYRVNVVGTRNLLDALARLTERPDSVLLASSANIYGNATEGVLAESARPDPANDYAVSKLAMEYMARLWNDRLPITIVRPFNYTGVGQSESFLLPKIVAHFKRGETTIELGNLDVSRDFGDVRSVAEAYRRLIEARAAGVTVNVCSGTVHSLREVVAMVEQIAGRSIEIKVNPAFVRANEVRILQGCPDRLRSIIGDWGNPPLRDTLAWMLK
ncbi:MAG: GDP-mannose 4,6-dehydratase [Rhodocyclaceae bacterium]